MAQGRQAESPAVTGSHSIDEDFAFQEREWTIQRIGWIIMTMFVLAALLGLAGGGGPIASETSQTVDGSLTLRYSRIERTQTSTDFELDIATRGRDEVEIWIAGEFLAGVELESIRPEPTESRAGTDRQIFVFAVADGAEEIQVSIQYRHHGFGVFSSNAGVVEGQELAFRQLIVP